MTARRSEIFQKVASRAGIFGPGHSRLMASLSLHGCYKALSQPDAQIYITAIFDRGLSKSIPFIVSKGPEENNATQDAA